MQGLRTCTPPGTGGDNPRTPTRGTPASERRADSQTAKLRNHSVFKRSEDVDHLPGDDHLLDKRSSANTDLLKT
eukprot:7815239-Alexandrium_andersonii.AAC.1